MKILLSILIMTFSLSAGKIFLNYEFNQDISTIKGLTKIKNTNEFPKPFEIYKNEDSLNFIFYKGKLKTVNATLDDFDLKTEIEKVLKNGFRLKSIEYKDRYGKVNVKNVGELIEKIKIERKNGEIFNSRMDATLLFKNSEKATILFLFREGIERQPKNCKSCEYINGKDLTEYKILDIYFTEKD